MGVGCIQEMVSWTRTYTIVGHLPQRVLFSDGLISIKFTNLFEADHYRGCAHSYTSDLF